MTIISRSLLPLLRYSHACCISSTPHVRSAGWVDKIKGVFTGKSSSSSFSLTSFVDQMEKARSMGMVNVSESFNKQSAILRYLASVDPTGEVQKLMGSTPVDVAKSGKLGRNSPCSCGSGKKYKRCCGPP